MNYTSTRDNSRQVTAQEAIVQGISPEGGLFAILLWKIKEIATNSALSFLVKPRLV